jgi:hypothetical protein
MRFVAVDADAVAVVVVITEKDMDMGTRKQKAGRRMTLCARSYACLAFMMT